MQQNIRASKCAHVCMCMWANLDHLALHRDKEDLHNWPDKVRPSACQALGACLVTSWHNGEGHRQERTCVSTPEQCSLRGLALRPARNRNREGRAMSSALSAALSASWSGRQHGGRDTVRHTEIIRQGPSTWSRA